MLDVLKEKRHKLVHEGITDIFTDDDLNILRSIVEDLVEFLMIKGKDYENIDGLKFFLNNYRQEEKSLQNMVKVLKTIGVEKKFNLTF